jgi:large subunit ribosomal protein L19
MPERKRKECKFGEKKVRKGTSLFSQSASDSIDKTENKSFFICMTHQLLSQSTVVTSQVKENIPDFRSGSLVDVHYKIIEGGKERTQIFSGVVISRRAGNASNASFTVLKNSTAGIKVERVFPLHSPLVAKIVVNGGSKRAKRSKLYNLHDIKDPTKGTKTKAVKAK